MKTKRNEQTKNWPIENGISTTAVVELHQASNSPSPGCKEFITQPESTQLFSSLSHVVIINRFRRYTHVCAQCGDALRLDFVWKQKTNTNRAGLKDLFSNTMTAANGDHSYTCTRLLAICVHQCLINEWNELYTAATDQNDSQIHLYLNEVATTRLSCPKITSYCIRCGYLLPAVLLISTTCLSCCWDI